MVKEWNVGTLSSGLTADVDEDTLIIGRDDQLRRFATSTGELTPFDEVPAMTDGERINDLGRSPDGALWVATMDGRGERPTGRLLRRTPDGAWLTVLRGVPIVNGPAFDARRDCGYVCDSVGRRVLRFPTPPITSTSCEAATTFLELGVRDGSPDGIAVDDTGDLWVAQYGGSRATRFTADGRVAQVIAMPDVNVTSVAIGEDTLFLTTARHSPPRGASQSGGVYALPHDTATARSLP